MEHSSSFISNFKSILVQYLPGLADDVERALALGTPNVSGLVGTFLLGTLSVTAFYIATKRRWHWRFPIQLIAVLMLLRVMFFMNPLAWYAYFKLYSWEDVGFRERDVIAYNIDRFFIPRHEKYLAIGSSQVGAVFGDYADNHADFRAVQFAGITPVEYMLYRDVVDRHHPEYVILYLSEFDMGRMPTYPVLKYAPFQGEYLADFGKELLAYNERVKAFNAFKEMFAANLFPEFKHNYIFKGGLKRFLHDPVSASAEAPAHDSDSLKRHISGLSKKLSSQPLAPNYTAITRYIDYCLSQGAKVVVVEGQYHPAAQNERLLKLRRQVQHYFSALDASDPNIYYFAVKDSDRLSGESFGDAYHVKGLVGLQLSKQVVDEISRRTQK